MQNQQKLQKKKVVSEILDVDKEEDVDVSFANKSSDEDGEEEEVWELDSTMKKVIFLFLYDSLYNYFITI